jgi:hypothetical protein
MRSGSRSQAESQFNIQTTEKESNMTSGRLMKHLFLPLLGFGVIAAATAAFAQTAPPAFVSAIGDNTNVVFVENHIVIDRPANEIFDFVSTPGNIYKWFTKSSDAKPFISGALDLPNRVGDQVFENLDLPDGRKLSLVQTTVVCIPGFEWVVTGQPVGSDGKPLPRVLSLAVWTVQPLPGGKSLFSRFFSLVGAEGSVTVSRSKNAALDPVGSQAALERLKKYLEGSQKKN